MAMAMTGDRAHRGEHARIFYPAAFELLDTIRSRTFSRSIAIAGAIIRRHYTDTPGNDYRSAPSRLYSNSSAPRPFRRLISELTGI